MKQGNNEEGANPQRENGHVDIANELVEQLAKINLRPYEWRTVWALFRKTYGWHKKEDRISISQFQKLTGLERRHQRRALKTLKEKNIITRNKDGYIVAYGFQKDYTKWEVVPKQALVKSGAQTSTRVVPKQAPKLVPKQAPTKEKKETIQKKESILPYIQKIIRVYKEIKGYDNQPEWDKHHYKRHSAPASQLYGVAGEDWEEAMRWVSKQGYCDWTLETVIKKFPDFQRHKNTSATATLGSAGRVLND
jgi:phage replication O-like protein O